MKKIYVLFLVFLSLTLIGCNKDKGSNLTTNVWTGQTDTQTNVESWVVDTNWENQVLEKSKIQEIMDEIKINLGEGAWEIKSDEFEWRDLNSKASKVKGFSIFDTSFDNELESFFRTWSWSVNNIADSTEQSVYWYQKDDVVCLIENNFEANWDTVGQVSTKVNCWQLENIEIPQINTQNPPKSDDLVANTLSIDAFWEEPFWNINLNWDNLSFTSPNSQREYVWTTMKQGNDFVYNWNWETWSIKVTIKEEKCVDNSIWDEHRYKVSLVIDWNINREWCWDLWAITASPSKKVKSLYEDSFFDLWKTWPINELEKRINLEIDEDEAEYTINEYNDKYLQVWISFPVWWYVLILKNTDTWWIKVAWFQDIDDELCEKINQEHNEIIDWEIFYNCAKW